MSVWPRRKRHPFLLFPTRVLSVATSNAVAFLARGAHLRQHAVARGGGVRRRSRHGPDQANLHRLWTAHGATSRVASRVRWRRVLGLASRPSTSRWHTHSGAVGSRDGMFLCWLRRWSVPAGGRRSLCPGGPHQAQRGASEQDETGGCQTREDLATAVADLLPVTFQHTGGRRL